MSADNAWYIGEDASGKFYVFGGFASYVDEWDSPTYGHLTSLEEKRDYILRHPGVHKEFDDKDAAILYAHKLDSGEEDSYWNPKTDMFGDGTEYGVCVIKLPFKVKED